MHGLIPARMLSHSLQPHEWEPVRLHCPWDYPSKSTGVGCHFCLQGNLTNPGIKLESPEGPDLSGGFFTIEPPGKFSVSYRQKYFQSDCANLHSPQKCMNTLITPSSHLPPFTFSFHFPSFNGSTRVSHHAFNWHFPDGE